uniref:Rab-GAP TBC domain-containing protein n=1 Tax=Angiostrongylus cantonensis TaxID=6313 RepID=A0A0K0CZL4_ANGCA
MSHCGSLATVVENLPLCYNTDTKSLDRAPSQNSGSPSDQPFKRGHIRRSSYESTQIQLNFARRMTTPNSCTISSIANIYCICSGTFNAIMLKRNFSLFSGSGSSKPPWFFGKEKIRDSVVIRTTGLILEERPSSLPAKPSEEAARHKQLYYDMIAQMKKKEQRVQKERRQAHFEKVRLEEQAKTASRLWTEKILPNWNEAKETKRCYELWWQGIPPKIRGPIEFLSVGASILFSSRIAHLELYELNCTKAAMEVYSHENSLSQIRLDIARTFPSLGFFQENGPYYDHLMKLLGAYSCFRPSVGYLQSMAFIAAVLLLQMDLYPAFVAFANLLNRPLQTAFFELRQSEMTKYFIAYDRYLEQELPILHQHLDKLDVRPDLYLIEWIYTLFAKSLPLDITCRIWDVYFRDGEEFIFETALGILRMYESRLLSMDFDECVEFLTQLPEKMSSSDLFRNIEPFVRSYSAADISRPRKRFVQILSEVEKRVNQGDAKGHDAFSRNLKEVKMSKSLSGFINDLFSSPSYL